MKCDACKNDCELQEEINIGGGQSGFWVDLFTATLCGIISSRLRVGSRFWVNCDCSGSFECLVHVFC